MALLVAGTSGALGAKGASSRQGHHNKPHTRQSHPSSASHKALLPSQKIALKIKAFKPGDRAAEARHFDFENYSFVTLDEAARRLFPAGTKLSYVDKVLKGQGKAAKSKVAQNKFVHYDYHFKFDRFSCIRTVSVSFDSKTKRVLSARGDGQCS